MRLLTWNTHVGHRGREARQAEAIRETRADIAVLQEVVEGAGHAGLLSRGWPHAAFAKARGRRGGGHQGTLLLSKIPFAVVGRWDLSNHPLERRVALCVALEGGPYLVAVHLDLTGIGRRRQLARMETHLAEVLPLGAPLLLAGDCNDWSSSLDRRLLRLGFHEAHRATHGRCARTFPSRVPVLALDRIYGRGARFSATHRFTGLPWRTLSDHLPLITKVG